MGVTDYEKSNYCLLVFRNHTGKCLHLDCGSTSNGTKLHLWDILDESHPDFLNQVWIIDGHLIRSAKAPRQVIHLESNWIRPSHCPGTYIHLWSEVESGHKDESNQEWIITGDGAIVCRSKPEWGWNAEDWGQLV